MKTTRVKLLLRWEPPPALLVKLNLDGSSIGNPGPASTWVCTEMNVEESYLLSHNLFLMLQVIWQSSWL
ncbi:hypothetical protein FRX31_025585 [Thalictrum thalictroides]|uniref:Uncharacterized protein n=1 Tax=Thalictrum thalictroides TaxID=46969 RepID=A0A7J6VJR2_THATH|nr:hypothetical protein FRX31_025585 [Thalictrum thalictroides]